MRDWANASRSGELQLSMQCEETTSRRKAKRTPSPLPAKRAKNAPSPFSTPQKQSRQPSSATASPQAHLPTIRKALVLAMFKKPKIKRNLSRLTVCDSGSSIVFLQHSSESVHAIKKTVTFGECHAPNPPNPR